jgi:cytochrome c553
VSEQRIFSLRDSWFTVSTGITIALVVLAVAVGFVLLPYAQANLQFAGVWDAICGAAGVPRVGSVASPVAPDLKLSQVVMTPDLLRRPSADQIGRGATLAQECAICHGPTGVSRADSPNLAGQYGAAVFKQLVDFRTGARINAVMTPFAVKMSEDDMRDVAAYYAYLPRLPGYHPANEAPPALVINGAPLRGIAPCGACHGGIENKAGSPWLEGQPRAYIRSQLDAFASGARHNDISEQMRNVARRMTPEEIDAVATYYAAQPAGALHTTEH